MNSIQVVSHFEGIGIGKLSPPTTLPTPPPPSTPTRPTSHILELFSRQLPEWLTRPSSPPTGSKN